MYIEDNYINYDAVMLHDYKQTYKHRRKLIFYNHID